MKICRACGETWFRRKDHSKNIDKYAELYFLLTAIQLKCVLEPAKIWFCNDCTIKLENFDLFRRNCLEVHQRLQNVKVEDPQINSIQVDEICVKVEAVLESSEEYEEPVIDTANAAQDNDSDGDDDSSFDAENEDNDDDDDEDDDIKIPEFEAADVEEKDVSEKKPKKKRAKWGSLPKKEPKKPLEFINCHLCPKKFLVQHRLDAHLRVHQGLKPFFCEICGRDFHTYKNRKSHMLSKHSDDFTKMPCDHPGCDQTFITKLGKVRHYKRYHDPNYEPPEPIPFICDTCGKSFTTNGTLVRHRYTHAPEEMPFACDICGKKFMSRHKLRVHKARHAGIKNFECSICGLRKTSKDELRTHVRKVHEKKDHVQKVVCDLCGAEFSQRGALKRHVDVVHLGQRPHTCLTCGRTFAQKDHLKRHAKTHLPRDANVDLLTAYQ